MNDEKFKMQWDYGNIPIIVEKATDRQFPFPHLSSKEGKKIESSYINNIQMEFFQMIEKQLEEIINAPSTVNSIIKFYSVAIDEDDNYFLVFNNSQIVRRWGNPIGWWHQRMILEVWCQQALPIRIPPLIGLPK